MEKVKVEIKKLKESAKIPKYETEEAAGMDISACLSTESVKLYPGETLMVDTGIAVSLPKGYEFQVRSRSGLAAKNGVFVLNSPGTIDSDYHGEIKVILRNTSSKALDINHGDRIAQLVLSQVPQAEFEEVDIFSKKTDRGEDGFGSTGVK